MLAQTRPQVIIDDFTIFLLLREPKLAELHVCYNARRALGPLLIAPHARRLSHTFASILRRPRSICLLDHAGDLVNHLRAVAAVINHFRSHVYLDVLNNFHALGHFIFDRLGR